MKEAFDAFGGQNARSNRIKMDLARSDRREPTCQETLIPILCRRTACTNPSRQRPIVVLHSDQWKMEVKEKENEDWLLYFIHFDSVLCAPPAPE